MKILLMTDNPSIATGMARVGYEIAKSLVKGGHDVVYLGWYSDISIKKKWPFKLYSVPNKGYGRDQFDNIVYNERPDVVLTIGDPWMYSYIADPKVCKSRRLFQWIGYVAVDGEKVGGGVPNFWKPIINCMDRVITYTNYGRDVLTKSFPHLENNIDVIYHGVDEKKYFPMSKEEITKQRTKLGLTNQFVFLMVARNCGRKNIPELFKAWKIMMDNKMCPNSRLWPHMFFQDSMGVNIDDLIWTLGLNEGKTIMFFDQIAHGDTNVELLPESQLNILYNVCDAFVSLGGEGFGLPVIEAMATKTPCVVLNHSATGELGSEERAFLIDTGFYATGLRLTERPMPKDSDVAKVFEKAYKNTVQKEDMKNKAYEFAMTYTWKKVGRTWLDWFYKLEHPTSSELILEEVC